MAQHLAQARAIDPHLLGHIFGNVEVERQALFQRLLLQRCQRLFEHGAQIASTGKKHHLPTLQLRVVQDVVDHQQQMLCGAADVAHGFQALGVLGELFLQQSVQPQDGVHGRAQLVAHGGDKLVFVGAGQAHVFVRHDQRLVALFALLDLLFGEVVVQAHHEHQGCCGHDVVEHREQHRCLVDGGGCGGAQQAEPKDAGNEGQDHQQINDATAGSQKKHGGHAQYAKPHHVARLDAAGLQRKVAQHGQQQQQAKVNHRVVQPLVFGQTQHHHKKCGHHKQQVGVVARVGQQIEHHGIDADKHRADRHHLALLRAPLFAHPLGPRQPGGPADHGVWAARFSCAVCRSSR